MSKSFAGRVAIVTGAGNGLGRSHALALAAAGAKVVVNDVSHEGHSDSAAAVVEMIAEQGGRAIACNTSVTDVDGVQDMVTTTLAKWGRIDILVNNAGILRDKTFMKMTEDDFRSVMEVHVFGAFHCTKAVWETMREQQYGRIVMTSSVSGLYGNFGQSNYGAAKMALVGFMNTLHLEGRKYDIRVNSLAPSAYTAMMEGLVDGEFAEMLATENVSPGVLFLAGENAPSKMILGAGAGCFAVSHIYESPGLFIPKEERSADTLHERIDDIAAPAADGAYDGDFGQTKKFLMMAKAANDQA